MHVAKHNGKVAHCRKIKGWRSAFPPLAGGNPDKVDAAGVLVRLISHQLFPLMTNNGAPFH